jgi:hypothetical protein
VGCGKRQVKRWRNGNSCFRRQSSGNAWAAEQTAKREPRDSQDSRHPSPQNTTGRSSHSGTELGGEERRGEERRGEERRGERSGEKREVNAG